MTPRTATRSLLAVLGLWLLLHVAASAIDHAVGNVGRAHQIQEIAP